jgi:flagellar FliJ protein
MKRFKFSLETVEKVRKIRADETLAVLATARNALSAEIAQKTQLLRELANSVARREHFSTSEQQQITALDLQLEQALIQGHKIRIEHADRAIVRAQKRVDKALHAHLEAKRRHRSVEMLREKKLAEYRAERKRWEQKQLEDLQVMRAQMVSEVQG